MKYIIEFEDEYSMNEGCMKYHQCKQVPYWSVSEGIIKGLTPYTEPDRKAIEDEVWEFVKEIILKDNGTRMSGMFENELNECFGYPYYSDMFANLSYQEAKAMYEAWKKQKEDKPRFCDEVEDDSGIKAVVMDTDTDGEIIVFTENGCVERWGKYHKSKKTGRHFPEVVELLKKMRGEEE